MILVVGDVMLDRYFWGVATRLSPEAPVPVVQVIQVSALLGGAGNVAANLVGMQHEIALVGACGKDPAADALRHTARGLGLTDYLVEEKDRPTTTKTRVVAGSQQITRIDEEIMKELYKKGKVEVRKNIKKVLPKCKAVIVSDYAKGVVDNELVKDILELTDVPVFVDPKGVNWEKYAGAFCVTPNFNEFMTHWQSYPREKSIDSETQLRNAVREVAKGLGLEYMVVTRGAGGILVVPVRGQMYQLDVDKIDEVVDVSGAGDTVIATLASQTTKGVSMKDAAVVANERARIVIGRLGTSPITREDIVTDKPTTPLIYTKRR
jgi:D-beta-D-heptose 7-phosphate kinase/D-beta-D-heptose 1-phosphate adenosyltransferase